MIGLYQERQMIESLKWEHSVNLFSSAEITCPKEKLIAEIRYLKKKSNWPIKNILLNF